MASKEYVNDQFRGCLIGGAIGDALGAPVEFLSMAQIRSQFGPNGVTEFAAAFGTVGAITDDTQMTLFTAEAMIRASVRARSKGVSSAVDVAQHAYFRWLHTQGDPWSSASHRFGGDRPDGWLANDRRLYVQRAPGMTCLSALRAGGLGTIDKPTNDSKGCGGVMRVAPVGLIFDDPRFAFETGCKVAALTHGHRTGWLAAGTFAAIIAYLIAGNDLDDAVGKAKQLLKTWPGHEETSRALDLAEKTASKSTLQPEDLERIGGGWVAEEALAIAVCCALSVADESTAILRAVNHSGDSDSTGSICGNIVGTVHGFDALPSAWCGGVQMSDTILRLANDLFEERYHAPADEHGEIPDSWWEAYPGW